MAVKSRIDLTEGPIGRHLVNLTIPMFLGISSMIVASLIDTVYVGWIGTLELAAVSFTFPVVMAMATVSMGLGIGASSIIARVVGAGDEKNKPQNAKTTKANKPIIVRTSIFVTIFSPPPLLPDIKCNGSLFDSFPALKQCLNFNAQQNYPDALNTQGQSWHS